VSVQTFKAALLARYPKLFVKDHNDGDGWVRGPDELYIAAELMGDGSDLDSEGRPLFDHYAFEHDPKEVHYVFGVHREVHNLAIRHKVFIEWRDGGSVGVYPN
jgi:hypothetical protein